MLKKLGYTQKNGAYVHPERRALFVGDYIDRGPKIKETLDIVRRMVDAEAAIALMGNHEHNALCFNTPDGAGGYLREHSEKNKKQYFQTQLQFQDNPKEHKEWLAWFMTLPLLYETPAFRAVHACWDPKHIALLRRELVDDRLTEELIYRSTEKGTRLYEAIDETLKGKELCMPEGQSFKDKDDTDRDRFRYKWWKDPKGSTYGDMSVLTGAITGELAAKPIDLSNFPGTEHYTEHERPVFFGHYWLQDPLELYRSNVCCVDYSVANKGKLVAYRFDGEQVLGNERFVEVPLCHPSYRLNGESRFQTSVANYSSEVELLRDVRERYLS